MAEDGEQETLPDSNTERDSQRSREGVAIEGLRPPLTRKQRRRRIVITAIQQRGRAAGSALARRLGVPSRITLVPTMCAGDPSANLTANLWLMVSS